MSKAAVKVLMCCNLFLVACLIGVAGTMVKILAEHFAKQMAQPAPYIVGCAIVMASMVAGILPGVAIGSAIGAAIDRKENAKRPMSPDNQRAAELGCTFLGALLGATLAAAAIPAAMVFMLSWRSGELGRPRAHKRKRPPPRE